MRHGLGSLALVLLLAGVTGCAGPGYYYQAVSGQIEILNKRRPVEAVLSDPATAPQTRRQLELVQRLRDFASDKLGLPDNRSYRSYADLERPFVVWNVLATPELSLEPKKWCFVLAGCVSYRGYFVRDKAEKFAAGLKQGGYDVYIGGVPAYSTLGWFSDPLLNTFLYRDEADLAGLLFHELAHQEVYVGGDTTFNESFATVVELEGVRRWFEHHGSPQQAQFYRRKIQRRKEFMMLVLDYRSRLEKIYKSNRSDAEKRASKMKTFLELKNDYIILKKSWGENTDFDGWFNRDLNNAMLATVGIYHQDVAAFQRLLAEQNGDLAAFYHAVRRLTRLSRIERDAKLRKKFLSDGDSRGRSPPSVSE